MTIGLPKRVAENIDSFTGRTWLLPKMFEWWERTNERIFLLTGGPGSGKSMVLAWLAGFGPAPLDPVAEERLTRLRKTVRATHFCDASSRNVTPSAFAESIANQLTNNVTGFAEALAATLAERVQISATQTIGTIARGAVTGVSIGRIDLGTLGDELSFDRAFTEPLKKLYATGYTEPVLMLVDALDEAQAYTGVTVPDLLSRLTDLPLGVRILATTREDPRVLKFFRNIETFDLAKHADPNIDDVRTYTTQRLTKPNTINDGKRTAFAERLSGQANGVFLYAAMVLDELLKGPSAELPDLATYPLPEGLSGLYHDFLTRELGKDEHKWFDLFETLLGLIAVAHGDGLSTRQLAAIVGKDIRGALRACKQYLSGELPEGPFRPFHKSFADFLLEDKHNLDYRVDAQTMHRRIATHFSAHGTDWSQVDDYGLLHVGVHLLLAGDSESRRHLYDLLCPSFMRAKHARFGTHRPFQEDISLVIETASSENPLNIVELARASLIYARLGEIAALTPEAIGVLAYGDEQSLRMALSHAALIPEVWLRSEAFRSIAESLASRGRTDDARVALEQALDLGGKWVRELSRLGCAFFTLGDSRNALKALDQALVVARDARWTRGSDLANVARAFAEVGEQRIAIAVAEEALQHIEASGQPEADSLKDIAGAARLLNAAALLERAISVAKAFKFHGQGEKGLAAVCEVLVEMDMMDRSVDEARTLLSPLCRARAFAALTAKATEGQDELHTQSFAEEALKALETKTAEHDMWSLMETLERLGETVLDASGPKALERLVSVAKRIDLAFWKLDGLARVMAGLKKAGHHQEADDVAHQISEFLETDFDRDETRGREEVASVLANAGFVDLALTVANCKDVRVRINAMSKIAGVLARHDEVERALGLVNSSVMEVPPEADDQVISALAEVGRVLAATGAGDRAATVFEDARRKAATLSDDLPKVRMFCEAARFLQGRGEHNRAADAARTAMTLAFDDYASKIRTSRIVIPRYNGWFEPYEAAIALAWTEQWEGLEKVVEAVVSTEDTWIRCQILPGLVEALVFKGERERAADLVERTKNEVDRRPPWDTSRASDVKDKVAYFCSLGRAWHRLGRSDDARLLVDKALSAMEGLGEPTQGSRIEYAAYVLFEVLGEVGTGAQLDRALAIALAVDDPRERPESIVHVAWACVQTGECGRALAAAERSTEAARHATQYERPIVLGKAARVMTACGQEVSAVETLADAFAEARAAGHRCFYGALEGGAATLAAIDQGDALWRMYEATVEVEAWWSSSL